MSGDTFVGLDVHAESITAAILHPGSDQPEVIKLSSDLMKVRRLFRRLSGHGPVRSCYEASGAGFVLQRVLAGDGFSCEVIAPSLIPRKPGEHRKFDRLDAVNLARLYRSGHLTAVYVPTEDLEAIRRLLRLRTTYTSTSPPPCTGSQASCVTTALSLTKASPPGPRSTACGLHDFA
jgi:transposase